MKKNEKHTKFVLTDELISKILEFINSSDDNSILETFSNYHHADIAEIIEELNSEGKTNLVHTLNGSSLALPRVLATIIENFQTEDGINIPKALQPYTGFSVIK